MTEKWELGEIRVTQRRNCCSSVHTWLNETKAWRNTVIIIIIEVKGDSFLTCPAHLTGTVISAFPVHAHTWLMSLWSHLQNDPERPASVTLLLGLRGHYRDLLGLGPHLDYEWESSEKARYGLSGSNTHPGSAVAWCMCCVSAAWWPWWNYWNMCPQHFSLHYVFLWFLETD